MRSTPANMMLAGKPRLIDTAQNDVFTPRFVLAEGAAKYGL